MLIIDSSNHTGTKPRLYAILGNIGENSMKSTLARTVLLFAGASLSFATLAATAGAQEGTASGTLTVAAKTTPLTHVYARAQKGFFDPTKEDILVILSDVAIPEDALSDEFARHKMAGDGKLHGVEVVLDADKQAVSGGLLHEAFAETQGYVSVAGMHEFLAKTFDGKVVEGTLSTTFPSNVFARNSCMPATDTYPCVSANASCNKPPDTACLSASNTTSTPWSLPSPAIL